MKPELFPHNSQRRLGLASSILTSTLMLAAIPSRDAKMNINGIFTLVATLLSLPMAALPAAGGDTAAPGNGHVRLMNLTGSGEGKKM